MSLPLARDYQFTVSPRGDILLVLHWQEDAADVPRLLYDGGDHALLMRTPSSSVVIPNLPESVRVPLAFSTSIAVRETAQNGETIHAYEARLHFAQDIAALRSIAETLRKDAA